MANSLIIMKKGQDFIVSFHPKSRKNWDLKNIQYNPAPFKQFSQQCNEFQPMNFFKRFDLINLKL